jgi:hypothetical protein
MMPQEHEVTISTDASGKPVCTPLEIAARRGDSVRWVGVNHTGRFLGRIKGSKQRGFTEADIAAGIEADSSKIPFSQGGAWGGAANRLEISKNAEPGAYKYSVTVNGVELDPVVIIEDDGEGGGPN